LNCKAKFPKIISKEAPRMKYILGIQS